MQKGFGATIAVTSAVIIGVASRNKKTSSIRTGFLGRTDLRVT